MELTVTEKGYKEFAEIIRAEAHGGKVLLLSEEGRTGEDFAAALALSGLKIAGQKATDALLTDYMVLSRSEPPEGIMAVVGAGGAAAVEGAKGIRSPHSVPRLLVPLDLSALCALDERAFFGTKGDIATFVFPDARVLFDPSILSVSKGIREGVGFLLAIWVEEFDDAYEALLLHGKCPAGALSSLKKAAARLAEISESEAASGICNAILSWAHEDGFFSSSRAQSAHVLAMLAAKASEGNHLDFLFPASYALLRLYSRYLSNLPLEHAAPPDRARNVELLEKRCGFNPSPLLSRMTAYADDYDDRFRLTAEYREDFREVLEESVLPLSSLSRLYRRAPKREEESPMPTSAALLSLLSLTGEAVSGYPLIKHIKTTGLLEPLLVAS